MAGLKHWCSHSQCPTLLLCIAQFQQPSTQMHMCPNTRPFHLSYQVLAFSTFQSLVLFSSNPPTCTKAKSQSLSDFPEICCRPTVTKQVHRGRAIQSVKAGPGLVKAECSFQMPMKNLGICVELDNLRGFFPANQILKNISISSAFFFNEGV